MTEELEREKRVRKAYPGSYYDTPGLERWLEEQALDGLQLEETTFFDGVMSFRKTAPRRVRYFAAPILGKKKKDRAAFEEELEKQCEELGWELIFSKTGVVKIYASEDSWAIKPKLDIGEEDWANKERGLWRELFFWFVSLAVVIVQSVLTVRNWNLHYVELLSYGGLMALAAVILPVLLSVSGVSALYSIYVVRKVHRGGDWSDRHRGAAFFRWAGQLSTPILIVLMVVCLFAGFGMSELRYRDPAELKDPVPMVTLALMDGEQGREPKVTAGTRNSLLVREIRVRSSWTGNGAFLWYGSGDNMELRYYRLLNEAAAARVAADEAGRESGTPLTDTGGFEEVWFTVDQYGEQFLSAWMGDVAVTIAYEGPGSLSRNLPEIYEIVADYRTNH